MQLCVITFCNLPKKISRKFEENNSKSLLYLCNERTTTMSSIKDELRQDRFSSAISSRVEKPFH